MEPRSISHGSLVISHWSLVIPVNPGVHAGCGLGFGVQAERCRERPLWRSLARLAVGGSAVRDRGYARIIGFFSTAQFHSQLHTHQPLTLRIRPKPLCALCARPSVPSSADPCLTPTCTSFPRSLLFPPACREPAGRKSYARITQISLRSSIPLATSYGPTTYIAHTVQTVMRIMRDAL